MLLAPQGLLNLLAQCTVYIVYKGNSRKMHPVFKALSHPNKVVLVHLIMQYTKYMFCFTSLVSFVIITQVDVCHPACLKNVVVTAPIRHVWVQE